MIMHSNLRHLAALAAALFLASWETAAADAKSSASPPWFLVKQSPPTPAASNQARPNPMSGCANDIAKLCTGLSGAGAYFCLSHNSEKLSGQCKSVMATTQAPLQLGAPACAGSTLCTPSGPRGNRTLLERVEWKQLPGYTFAYPYELPPAIGVLGVGFDSKGNFWAYERAVNGGKSLFKFGPDHKLILTVGEDVTGHLQKGHGMRVDAEDNVWICDSTTSVVEKISPEGKLLLTLGTMGHAGDWDETRGQHLLWQPVDIAFAPNGDFFIAEGHANESPNDADGPDPTDNVGAARVLHFDRQARFLNQIYGDSVGQGRFSMAHGVGVDPKTGYVWIGDREEYRLVVYKPDGEFVKTLQMRNLTCGIAFDAQGRMWVSTGQDGQVVMVDTDDGHVIAAIGNGPGKGNGEFGESNFMAWDKQGNLYIGDTEIPRVTVMMKPKT
jgi:sugar lactone lactonase YvrE